jgi:hypothetical protein
MSAVEERYSRAIRSSHLEVTEHPGDVDKLIAAGWLDDGFATTLYRLRVEYDGVAAEVGRVERVHRGHMKDAAAEAESVPCGPTMARQIEEEAAREFITGRLLILLRLKTLSSARQQLGAFAMQLANRRRHMVDNKTVSVIAGRVLDVFLDPNCHHCEGRGYNGGSHRGEPRVICRHCHGSGQRRGWIGRNLVEQNFAAALLAQLERMQGEVDGRMRAYLRGG